MEKEIHFRVITFNPNCFVKQDIVEILDDNREYANEHLVS